MGLADFYAAASKHIERLVSILVLMDGARRHNNFTGIDTAIYCFNPCFDGWGSPTRNTQADLCMDGRVSILVLMDGARRQSSVHRQSPATCQFQSLF